MNITTNNTMSTEVNEDLNEISIVTAKAITMVVLCAVSILIGIVPIQLNRHFKWNTEDRVGNPKSSRIVKLLLGFGGGVLLCTAFLHMLPELVESVDLLSKNNELSNLHLPLAELFVCSGFFIMYLVEELVHIKLRQHHSEAVIEDPECTEDNYTKTADYDQNMNDDNDNDGNEGCALGHIHRGHSHGFGHGHTHLPHVKISTKNENELIISSLKGLLIVLGLSVHELFEGLAIGLEDSSSHVWYMFAAVASHKFVIAFCIGVELVASKTRLYISIIYVCTFAIVSPLGIGIGMLLIGGNSLMANGPFTVILQSIATGTLLYVVFFEILHNNRDGLHQYFSILAGFILMCGLQFAIPHSHSHGHGDGHEHRHEYGQSHEHGHSH